MSEKLKPCPFCGGDAVMFWGGPDTHVTIHCPNTMCNQKITQKRLPRNSRITFEQLKAGTIERWNTRPIEDKLQEEIDRARSVCRSEAQVIVDYQNEIGQMVALIRNGESVCVETKQCPYRKDITCLLEDSCDECLHKQPAATPTDDTACGTCEYYDGACNCKQATDMYYKNLPADFPSCEKWSGK